MYVCRDLYRVRRSAGLGQRTASVPGHEDALANECGIANFEVDGEVGEETRGHGDADAHTDVKERVTVHVVGEGADVEDGGEAGVAPFAGIVRELNQVD